MLSRVFPHASIGRGRDQLSAEKSRKRCVLARPFALDGKLLGCFSEVRFPLFSSWPSARIVLGNTVVRSDNYWRFISGFCPIKSNPGRSGQIVQYMQIVQSRINTGDYVSR